MSRTVADYCELLPSFFRWLARRELPTSDERRQAQEIARASEMCDNGARYVIMAVADLPDKNVVWLEEEGAVELSDPAPTPDVDLDEQDGIATQLFAAFEEDEMPIAVLEVEEREPES